MSTITQTAAAGWSFTHQGQRYEYPSKAEAQTALYDLQRGLAPAPTRAPVPAIRVEPQICDDEVSSESYGKVVGTRFLCGEDDDEVEVFYGADGHTPEYAVLYAFGRDEIPLVELARVLPNIVALMADPRVQALLHLPQNKQAPTVRDRDIEGFVADMDAFQQGKRAGALAILTAFHEAVAEDLTAEELSARVDQRMASALPTASPIHVERPATMPAPCTEFHCGAVTLEVLDNPSDDTTPGGNGITVWGMGGDCVMVADAERAARDLLTVLNDPRVKEVQARRAV
jgi:hypothetical protein